MPVTVADGEDLAPFLAHLSMHGTQKQPNSLVSGVPGIESGRTPVPMLEFKKGVIYEDHRMDLCKMVVGPPHIDALLDSLDGNTFVEHFLLGNNIIGPRGARRIAKFIDSHPKRMQTWYLAGNCIDTQSVMTLTQSFVKSSAITNIWLKRNPLGEASADALFRLIADTANLRTLDLDQTTLGDAGVSRLFGRLANHGKPTTLQHLYLNGNGIGTFGASQLARYLQSTHCQLESLYISVNPLGNAGVRALADGLTRNRSIKRLSMESVGMSDAGAIALLQSLSKHPSICALNIGTAYQTIDLGGRFTYLTDNSASAICDLIAKSRTLALLDLGYTALSSLAYNHVICVIVGARPAPIVGSGADRSARPTSVGLMSFFCKTGSADSKETAGCRRIVNSMTQQLKQEVHERMLANVRAVYGRDMSYEQFEREEKRFLMSPRDVRLIDSVYRNRDAALARRGLKWLDKDWKEGDETLKGVMES